MPSRTYVQRAAAWQRRRYRRAWVPSISTEPATVTFPEVSLRSRARIALLPDLTQSWLTWNWLEITDRVRWDDGIELTEGRRDQSDLVDSSLAKLKVDNRDGSLSRKNPTGPWFGLLSKATPIWISLDPGTGFADMYFGFLVDLPKRWDRSATDSVIFVTARGLLHLLLRRQPLRSPMFYSVSGVAEDDFVPLTYHPFEDGIDAERVASGLPGGAPATFTGDVAFAAAEDLIGSDPLPFLDTGAVISGTIPPYTGGDQWFFQIALRIDLAPSVETTYFEIDTPGGDTALWRLYIQPDTPDIIWFLGYDSNGAPTGAGQGVTLFGDSSTPSEDDFYGRWWCYNLYAYVDPNDSFVYGGVAISDGAGITSFVAGSGLDTVLGTATAWRLYGGNGIAAGHAAFFTDSTFGVFQAVANAPAMNGYTGEMAHERVIRLCREQRIPLLCNATRSAVLGPQPRGRLLEVLRATEKADQGAVLYEHEFGLAYQSLPERYNQDVALTVDIALGQVAEDLEPDDNDLRFRNQWTAKRPDGSSATVQGRDGNAGETLGPTDPLYDDEDVFAVGTDAQLPHIAGWLAHRDSLEDDYWPDVAVNLAAHPELIPAWLAMRYGQRLNVLNVMEQAGIDTIDALREGHSQKWNSKAWTARMNTAPAVTYTIGRTNDPARAKTQTSNSSLAADVSDSATSLTVNITSGPIWTTTPANLQITVGGEVMAVTAIAGGSSPQTFTVTRSVNSVTKAHLAGAPVKVFLAAKTAL